MKRAFALIALALSAAVLLAGCNTVAGVGKDVQKVGEKVEGAAKK
ncbi:MAG: entericidin A/B family lipoprotein [Pseudoxanthomonas sp.]